MGYLYSGGQGMNSYPARQSYTAISAEAGLASDDNPTTFSAILGLTNIYNTSRSEEGGNRVIIPRKLELLARSVNSSAVDFRLHLFLDKINRWSSGGTLLTNFPTSGSEDADHAHLAGKAAVYVGELALNAASVDEKLVWRSWAMNEPFAVEDKLTVIFGSSHESIQAPDPEMTIAHVPPVFIGPGHNLSVHEVATSQVADPKFCYQLWWDEIETTGGFPSYPGT